MNKNKIYVLIKHKDDGIPYGNSYEEVIRAYKNKEKAYKELHKRIHIIDNAYTWSEIRIAEYELSKMGDCFYYRKDRHDESRIYMYEIKEVDLIE